jgi:hypothetical protein
MSDRKYVTTTILTDDPRQSGDEVRLEGVSWDRFLQNGFIFDSFEQRLDCIVGKPVSVRAIELDDVKGYELTFMLLKKLKPGRYGIGPAALVRRRDGKTVLGCQVMSACLTDRPADPNCHFTIEEDDDET